MIHPLPAPRRVIIAGFALAALVGAAGCSSSSPTVDTAAKPVANAPVTAAAPTGTGTSVVGTVDSAPGTTYGTDSVATAAGETTTTMAGSPPVTGANGVPITTKPTATTVPGGVTTVPGVATTAKPGSPTTTGVATTVTTVATTTPTTAAPPPELTASASGNDPQIHCHSGVDFALNTVVWSSTAATRVAVAAGKVDDAFANPINPDLTKVSSQLNVKLSCHQVDGGQHTTVTAEGPGGKTTRYIDWSIMAM